MPRSHVLLVEDDPAFARLMGSVLGGDYQVHGPAAQADEALALADALRPELAMVDIELAGDTDGIDLAQRLGDEYGVGTIFLTAHAGPELWQRARLVEPYGYLIKPVQPLVLISTIEMALYRHHKEKERRTLLADLTQANRRIKTLSGLLPICISCKQIRDDQGYWQRVESYIEAHSEALFSHCLCPECAQRRNPELSRAH